MIAVRRAGAGDAGAIRLLNIQLGYDYPEDKTAEKLEIISKRPTDAIFVAECDGKVAGYIHAADYDLIYSEPFKNILGLVVDEKFRGRGAGCALLAAVEKWAADTGAAGVRLNSNVKREEAHKFYLACGYINEKQHKNFVKMF